MKRTLTAAAAFMVSSAGAAGFAGTAAAADSPEFPADLPVDNGVAKTAFHAGGTAHSVQKTVGDVVPMDKQLTGKAQKRAGTPVDGLLGGGNNNPLGGNPLGGNPLGGLNGAINGNGNPLGGLNGALNGGPLKGATGKSEARSVGGESLNDVTGGSPLGNLPIEQNLPTSRSGNPDPLNTVTDVVSHGPLSSATNLGG